MNLSEFVEETLTEILAGIRSAQKKEGGDHISAEMYGDAFKTLERAFALAAGGSARVR
jgi:hypothetical protein